MINIPLFETQLLKHEGEKLRVYMDSRGIPTIGVGRNLKDKGISRAESRYLLRNDVLDTIGALEGNVPFIYQLTSGQQQALANLCFNLGPVGLLKFKNFLKFLKEGNIPEAKHHLLDSLWAKPVQEERVKDILEML